MTIDEVHEILLRASLHSNRTDPEVVYALRWVLEELDNAKTELNRAKEELGENVGVMNALRRHRSEAEDKAANLEKILNTERRLKKKFKWLPEYQFELAKCQRDKNERILGGIQDFKKNELVLVRGDFHVFTASFDSFKVSGNGTKPDFKKLDFIDGGFTVVLGDYQAASDAILEEVNDAEKDHPDR